MNFIDNDEANLLEPLLHHQAVEERVRLLHRAHVQRALVPPFLRREPATVTTLNKGQPFPGKDRPVPEFIDPRFRENKPKTLVFSHRKRALLACFRENCVYNFGARLLKSACAFSIVHTYSERLCRRFCGGNLQQLQN